VRRNAMNRRNLLTAAAGGAAALTYGRRLAMAQEHFPVQVDADLFKGINRVKNPASETVLEKLHSPVIKAPENVKAGEVFSVEVTIGETLHPMGPEHWIEYLQLNIGNQPTGTLVMRSHGYIKPEGRFDLVLGDALKGKTVSLVVQIKCNLHGIWQNYTNVRVV
jgi:superoxide reductase